MPDSTGFTLKDASSRLRKLDDVELSQLCLLHFPTVYAKFSDGMRRDKKIELLLDHCGRHQNEGELSRLMQALNASPNKISALEGEAERYDLPTERESPTNETDKEPLAIAVAKYTILGTSIPVFLTAIALLVAAVIGYLGIRAQAELPIYATLTADANRPSQTVTSPPLPPTFTPLPPISTPLIQITQPFVAVNDCPPTRLKTGTWGYLLDQKVIRRTVDWKLDDNIRGTAKAGEVVEIYDGPQCELGKVLWRVKTQGGLDGWVEETSQNDYYIAPGASQIVCNGFPESRLQIGDFATVTYFPPVPLRLREKPGITEMMLDLLPSGRQVEILDGPSCESRMVYWYVMDWSTGQRGWTSEGDFDNFYLAPIMAHRQP